VSSLICLDLETCGLDPRRDGLVEIAGVAIQDGAIVAEYSTLCWPGYEFIKEPSHWHVLRNVSRIEPAELLTAPTLEEAGDALLVWGMQTLGELPLAVTSYNRQFDAPFVQLHLPRVHERLSWRECLMLKATAALNRGGRWLSLARACEALGIARDGEHRALADCRAAAAVYLALEGRG
jgi:DNA polymerase III epsilon subunit-like protein